MFSIEINKDLLSYLNVRRMRVDDLLVMMCYGLGKMDLIRTLLWSRSGDQCSAFMQSLERKGLVRRLSPGVEDFDWDNYVVTEAGNVVYEDCLAWVKEPVSIVDVVAVECTDDELRSLVDAFVELWPPDARNINGDKLIGHAPDIEKKLKAFVKKYKFTQDVILRATQNYLSRQRTQGYAYCNQAHYFISKDGISKLAGECDLAGRNVENTSTWETRM